MKNTFSITAQCIFDINKEKSMIIFKKFLTETSEINNIRSRLIWFSKKVRVIQTEFRAFLNSFKYKS